ncbi:MAG: glutamyl-tRNA reductase [Acidimicrobiales bacterium]
MALISVGIDHEHASLDLLERVTVLEHEWSKVLRTLISQRNIHEAVFVSTCLRTEVVAVIDRFHGAIEEITTTLAETTSLAAAEFEDKLTVHFDRGVANHLFSVAAGLKSVVPGEFEILGQLRRALELAVEEDTAGSELTDLFQRALAAGRRVRTETAIARGTTSFAQASVTMAVEELGEQIRGARVVVIGAGQLASGVVKSLLDAPQRIGELVVCNRTIERARALRDEVADERVIVADLEHLSTHLVTSRLAIACVETTTPLITKSHVSGTTLPLLLVDLGVPRAISVDVDEVANVRRADIGDLRERIERVLGERHEAADQAASIVEHDVEKYLNDQRARGAAAIVSELRERLDEIVESEVARRESDLADLSDEQRERVQSLVRSVVAKIAHRPTIALKEAAGTDQGIRLNEATRSLFDL